MRNWLNTIACAIALFFASANAASNDYGAFVGRVVTDWSPDGLTMTLVEPFAYIAPDGLQWNAPKGSVVDGASIPRLAWSIVGGPFEGKYREASVIHDVACVEKSRAWQDVHRAFYTAMLANGVGPVKAKVMYGAVYHFGPRWERSLTAANVMLQDITRKADGLVSHAYKGDRVSRVEITQVSSASMPSRVCMNGLCTIVHVASEPRVEVAAIFVPETNDISEADFERLVSDIENNGLSLDEIENYRGSHN